MLFLLRGETPNNSSLETAKYVYKSWKNVRDLTPIVIPKQKAVTQKKKIDLNQLLVTHYGENWRDNEDLKFNQLFLDEKNEMKVLKGIVTALNPQSYPSGWQVDSNPLEQTFEVASINHRFYNPIKLNLFFNR